MSCSNLCLWMTELPDSVKSRPISKIAIPGTHDSMTYSITRTSKPAPDAEAPLVKAYKIVPFSNLILSPYISKWCRTQTIPVEKQLRLGIRYFDLRVGPETKSQTIRVIHGLYGSPVLNGLLEINNFLSANRGEVVVIDFQHFYGFTKQLHERLINMIVNIFGRKLCYRRHLVCDVTLSAMVQEGCQVIIVYRNEAFANHNFLWSSSQWPTPWPNTTDPQEMIEFVNKYLRSRSQKTGFISQFILTPTLKSIASHFFSSLETTCGVPAMESTLEFLKEIPSRGNTLFFNICICDFISQENEEFCRRVINTNYYIPR